MSTLPPIPKQGARAAGGFFSYDPQIWNSLIDSVIFYLGNYLTHGLVGIKSPELHHLLIFLSTDVAVRNGFSLTGYGTGMNNGSGRIQDDFWISSAYVAIASLFDLFIEKESIKIAILQNIFRGAVGFSGNVATDTFILQPPGYR
jgi:hypothetical protein